MLNQLMDLIHFHRVSVARTAFLAAAHNESRREKELKCPDFPKYFPPENHISLFFS